MTDMTDDKFPFLPRLIATSFGAGYWPWGPGTAGAVMAVALWMPLTLIPAPIAVLFITLGLILLFTWLGVWSGDIAEKYWGPDPHRVVMDETVGQWISMLPLYGYATGVGAWEDGRLWIAALISLVAFRFFDIVKPLGVRRMETLGGGIGIMADDVLAGLYAAIVTLAFNTFVIL